MVMKGQFLERPTLIPLPDGLVLEGVSHRGRAPGVLVLPPPPAEGSGMDHVVGAELAFAVSHAGHQCLRFNYRGVGGSQGRPAAEHRVLLEDARCALELARDNAGGGEVVLVSIGGSDVVARALLADPGVAGWALIHPNLEPFSPTVPAAVVLPEADDRRRRQAWAACLTEGALSVIAGADRSYHRNLPHVGKAVVRLLDRVRASSGNP